MIRICKTLSPLHIWMLGAQFGWNWPKNSGGEDLFYFVNVFSRFFNYLPLEKGVTLQLIKLASPLPWMLCAKFGCSWLSGSVEEDEITKRLRTDRRRTTCELKLSTQVS